MNSKVFYSGVVIVVVFAISIVIYVSNPNNSLTTRSSSILPGNNLYEVQAVVDQLLYYLHAGHSGKVAYHLNQSNKHFDATQKLLDLGRIHEALETLQLSDDHYTLGLLHSYEVSNVEQSTKVSDIVSTVAAEQNQKLNQYIEFGDIAELSNTDQTKLAIQKAVRLRDIR